MLEIIGGALVGLLLLAGLYPLLLAAAVLVPTGLLIVGLFALNAGNWIVAVVCIVACVAMQAFIDYRPSEKKMSATDKFSRFERDGTTY
jgi:hypothetical protein